GHLIMSEDGLWNFTATKDNGAVPTTYRFQYEVVDGDGDKSAAWLTIHIPGFKPSGGTVEYSEGERFPDPSDPNYGTWGTVDEDWIAGGNQDNDPGAIGDGPGKDTVTATVTIPSWGVDGPAEHPFALSLRTVGDDYTESVNGGTIHSRFDPDP